MTDLTPKRVVEELDRYVIGQKDAKRSVSIAVRNRWRRQQLPAELRDEVAPKNILMIGPTGVGKTEIARRLAGLTGAPFLKVEASKYTEVGYVGRDVESMVRDLVGVAVHLVRSEHGKTVRPKAEEAAEERLLDLLLPESAPLPGLRGEDLARERERHRASRERLREKLRAGELDDRFVEIQVREKPGIPVGMVGAPGADQMGIDIQEMFSQILPTRTKARRVRVKDARLILISEEEENLFDREAIHREAVERTENSGVLFIDEIDKVASRAGDYGRGGPDVSREGVQRDLLPIVEGSTVPTRYGPVRTDHILFIAAGAFHQVSPSDLIPEFLGRFPIRVELSSLSEAEFARILVEPENSLVKQYRALLATEGVELEFAGDAVREIARIAFQVNSTTQNIGARRLYTILERVVEEVSFEGPDLSGQSIRIDADYVKKRLAGVVESDDLRRYIL